jgi:hypothetical protein
MLMRLAVVQLLSVRQNFDNATTTKKALLHCCMPMFTTP